MERRDYPFESQPPGEPIRIPTNEHRKARDVVAERPFELTAAQANLIKEEIGLPYASGEVLILDVATRRGSPTHGELRSDDHISDWEVILPFGMLHHADAGEKCAECGYDRAVYSEHTYHNISGMYAAECRFCGSVAFDDEWS